MPVLHATGFKFGGGNNRQARGFCVAAMAAMVLNDDQLLLESFHRIGCYDYSMKHGVGVNGSWLGDASSSYVDYTFEEMLECLIYRSYLCWTDQNQKRSREFEGNSRIAP